MLTVHEMLHEREFATAPFFELDADTFSNALAVLERLGKAQRFANDGESGSGVKFF